MAKTRGTSSVPMIMGIIGGVLGIPGSFCAGACAAGVTGAAGNAAKAGEIGNFYLVLGLVSAAAGLVFGILAKRYPVFAGAMMIIAAILGGITLVAGNMISLVVAILFLIGGFMSIFQKKEVIE